MKFNKSKFGLTVILCAIVLMTGCGRMNYQTKVVPAGTTAVIKKSGGAIELVTKGNYKILGRDEIYFADTKYIAKEVKIQVLCKDGLNMDVTVKWLGGFDINEQNKSMVCERVPVTESHRRDVKGKFFSIDEFWTTAMSDVCIAEAKSVISPYTTDNVNPNRDKIAATIKANVMKAYINAKYPITSSNVLIVNLDPPKEVMDSLKAIKKAELKDKENAALADADVATAARAAIIAEANRAAKIIDAKADAEANAIRNASLTPAILMVKQIESQNNIATGPNNSTIMMPYSALESGAAGTTLDPVVLKTLLSQGIEMSPEVQAKMDEVRKNMESRKAKRLAADKANK